MTTDKALIKVNNLEKSFGDLKVLKGINAEINKGDVMVVIGASGSGKSTFLRCLNLLEEPTSGQIIFNGEDITGMNVTERANKGIGFAFQQPVKFKGIRVLDLIRLASGKKISVTEACHYLSMVGLCAREYINREVNSSLSGGELKRIEIATVIARNSLLTVFDEPEAGIDLWSFSNLIDVFRRQREEIADRSILIISHQERILNIADEIIVLDSGSIVDRGDKDEVLPRLIGTPSAVDKCRGVYQA